MTKSAYEKEIIKQMSLLKISRKEAEELIAEDMKVDKMDVKEAVSDLSKEQRKAIKSVTKTTAKVTKKSTAPREKKIDIEKTKIIEIVGEFISTQNFDFVTVVNPEREITFKIGDNSYSLTLTRHRKPKAQK